MGATAHERFSDEAKRVFAGLLERLDREEGFDLAGALAERPAVENELRGLHERWRRLEAVLAGLGGQASALDDLDLGSRDAPVDPALRDALERIAARGCLAGRYEILERIGQGGMGTVYRVRDRDLDRELALKVLRRSPPVGAAGAAPDRRTARFLAEARLASRLDHPGIVPVHDVGIDERGRLYFTMSLVAGEDLRTVLAAVRARADGWTVVRALEVLARVCETVAFAHAGGVVHRDLKPANVMVGRFGEVHVLDWGLARPWPGPEGTGARVVAGTPAYMAPEQAAGGGGGVRADVYALGAILYEILAGRRPHGEDDAASFETVLAAVRAGPPADVELLAPGVDPELVAVCRKAMARDPEARYGSAAELAADLRAHLEGRVVRAHASGALAELGKWIRRNRSLAAAIATAVLAAIGGLAAVSLTEAHGRAEVLRLADSHRLDELERRAEALWPPVPANLGALEAWLSEAEALSRRRVLHETDLADLRADASADAERRWRTELLAALVGDLGRFADPLGGTMASVRGRIEFAQEIADRSLVRAAAAWKEAIDSIADPARSPRYRGLAIEPQLGLLPIGRDARSGLWEFACLASGVPPARGEGGTLELSPESAIVLVLIPPGDFAMGSAPGATSGDPWARDEETPRVRREVGAFFLAKHELTRAQWARARAGRPWLPLEGVEDPLDPAGGISWTEARAALRRIGLVLPNETQWEYAARADTQTRWWTGQEPGSLAGCANGARETDPRLPAHATEGPVRVDRLRPNAFGLHHALGNVAEWTEDAWRPHHDADPEGSGEALRVVRGGSYLSQAASLRSAARAAFAADVRSPEIGVRPARALE